MKMCSKGFPSGISSDVLLMINTLRRWCNVLYITLQNSENIVDFRTNKVRLCSVAGTMAGEQLFKD